MAGAKPRRRKKDTPTTKIKTLPSKIATAAKALHLDESEAIAILQSARASKPRSAISFPISRKTFSFGYFSDAHIGHKKFNVELFDYMVRYFKQEKPDLILNPGDHLEGMSGRPGHVYEMDQIGFDQQFKRAVELYSQLDGFDHMGIDGNHDDWYKIKNSAGLVVGERLQEKIRGYKHLGEYEGDLKIGSVRIKLFHANDGTAYAHSYKMQKLIESFSGGEKPHIVLSGHYHKALSMFSRGVYGFECGTICGQTGWMRGKKIQAHMGFGLIKVAYNDKGVERLTHTFVPWHEKQQ